MKRGKDLERNLRPPNNPNTNQNHTPSGIIDGKVCCIMGGYGDVPGNLITARKVGKVDLKLRRYYCITGASWLLRE